MMTAMRGMQQKMKENSSLRSSWRKLEMHQQEKWQKQSLSEGKLKETQEDKTAELNFAAEWQVEATEEENSMGDLVDLPICREEVQPRRLQKESQPWEQLDEIIEEIRRLMIRSAEETAKGS
jgi:hypothetical protein